MGLETSVSKVSDLNETWPLPTDDKSQGDDHMRLIKQALKSLIAFPSGAAQLGFPASVTGQGGKALRVKSDETGYDLASFEPANTNIQAHISNLNNPHAVTKAQVDLADAWTARNDGAGSGLDADMVDGKHFSELPGGAPTSMQVFGTAGTATYTKPAGITKLIIELVGAGGGGQAGLMGSSASFGAGGGAGGFCRAVQDASAITTVSVTVGTGGNGGSGSNGGSGGDGGNTSFGTYATAAGGKGGNGAGGAGGAGTGPSGTVNICGADGANVLLTGLGGESYFAKGSNVTNSNNPTAARASVLGAGGPGGYGITDPYRPGGKGGDGYVVVYEYK